MHGPKNGQRVLLAEKLIKNLLLNYESSKTPTLHCPGVFVSTFIATLYFMTVAVICVHVQTFGLEISPPGSR